MVANILIIEDETNLSNSIKEYLDASSFFCTCLTNIKDSINLLSSKFFDCILVDIGLPDGSGIDFIQYIKKKKIDSGIIVISAREQLDTRIEALEMGADDFLLKPFHLSELTARINALIRRRKFQGNDALEYQEIKVIISENRVKVNNDDISLTKKELELLIYFISNSQKVLTKEAISFNTWKNNSDLDVSNEIIYTHIKNLRKKLMEAGCKDYIKAIYGVGYKFGE